MIKTANLTRYSNDRFVNFFQSIVDMFDANDPNLGGSLTKLKDTTDELKRAYDFERRNKLTGDVESIDLRRDMDLRGIKFVLRGFALHYEDEKIEAAKMLMRSINDVDKNIDKLGYVEETNAVRQLATVWKNSATYTAALAAVGLSEWCEHLNTTNDNFQKVYLDRVDDEAAKDIVPITRLREPAIEQYKTFVQLLTAYATIDPDKYLPMVKQLNELIDQYNK